MEITFGKHKGRTIEEIWDEGDESYLLWLHGQDFVKEEHLDLWSYLDNLHDEIREDYEIEQDFGGLNWYDMF